MKVGKIIILGALGLVIGIGGNQPARIGAARRPSILRVVSERATVSQYKLTGGTIYKDDSLTKVKGESQSIF
ncbi:hypothetical protein [Lentilactobacillus parakefiri]|uniref:Uncharacterized protein n=1 Tax=Lentilactobacillus parakefiri TaxID=152332 RepID=A0A224VFC7_9LACO|nr:hypothetical protein [Lentilactobacillus parakefiri]TDG91181.1 hypothetical protein C5L28_002383 [Lentilactobacillus parakefiri]GAW71813.1 hypothetical protein LPKJCM_00916 [Lentilactobacillus parakefiri]